MKGHNFQTQCSICFVLDILTDVKAPKKCDTFCSKWLSVAVLYFPFYKFRHCLTQPHAIFVSMKIQIKIELPLSSSKIGSWALLYFQYQPNLIHSWGTSVYVLVHSLPLWRQRHLFRKVINRFDIAKLTRKQLPDGHLRFSA